VLKKEARNNTRETLKIKKKDDAIGMRSQSSKCLTLPSS
jgi:hypothetical protein